MTLTVPKSAAAVPSADAERLRPILNPATGEQVGVARDLEPREVAAAAEAARRAQPAWQALGFAGRRPHLLALRDWILEHRRELTELVVAETGKTWEEASLTDTLYLVDALTFWADAAEGYLADEPITAHHPLFANRRTTVVYEPVGVVGVIGPWNTPLELNFGDAIPALAAGNTVVVKPSEYTPLANLLVLDAISELGWPQDVVQVVTGDGATGAAVVDAVDMVMFTGSTHTGRRIAARAAERLIPVSLELGGKDAMIVLDDADLERAANAAVYYGLQNNGQNCQAIERVYVQDSVFDAFVEKVVAKAGALRQGIPDGPGSVDLGFMVMPEQVDKVQAHVDEAVAGGAHVLLGGERLGPRAFAATVVVDVDQGSRLMQDETFGPVLAINRVADAEQALELTNDSAYGLNASVWTADLQRGEQLARRINSGMACVNDALINLAAIELPFGGIRGSGVGTPRHGAPGIRKYTNARSLLVTHNAPERDPHFYPYSADVTAALEGLLTGAA